MGLRPVVILNDGVCSQSVHFLLFGLWTLLEGQSSYRRAGCDMWLCACDALMCSKSLHFFSLSSIGDKESQVHADVPYSCDLRYAR